MIALFPSVYTVEKWFRKRDLESDFFTLALPLIEMDFYPENDFLEVGFNVDPYYRGLLHVFIDYILESSERMKWEEVKGFMRFASGRSVRFRDFLEEYRALRNRLLFLEHRKPRERKMRVAVAAATLSVIPKLAYGILPGNFSYAVFPSGSLSLGSRKLGVSVREMPVSFLPFIGRISEIIGHGLNRGDILDAIEWALEKKVFETYVKRLSTGRGDVYSPNLGIDFVYDVFMVEHSPKFMVYVQRKSFDWSCQTVIRELDPFAGLEPYSSMLEYVLEWRAPPYFLVLVNLNPYMVRNKRALLGDPLTVLHRDVMMELKNVRSSAGSNGSVFERNWIEAVYSMDISLIRS